MGNAGASLSLDVHYIVKVRIDPVVVAGWVFFVPEILKSVPVESLLHWDLAVDEGEVGASPGVQHLVFLVMVLPNQLAPGRKALAFERTGASWSHFIFTTFIIHPGELRLRLFGKAVDNYCQHRVASEQFVAGAFPPFWRAHPAAATRR